jgi:signal transduction histidine kinase
MHTNDDAQMKKALLHIKGGVALGKVNVNTMTLQLAAQQDERKRIAQELHDTLLQGFTGIALKLDALTTSLPPALSKTKQQLQQALEQMDHCLEETRRSIWNLRSPTLQSTEDFSKALLEASERALAGTAITLSFLVQGAARKLGNVLEHHLLRVCEEALANVVKHAHPTRVEVVLDFTAREVQLQIRDNGCGFEPTSREVSKRGHFGLLGIKERVASLFGVLSVDGAPGRGTRLLVTIPTKGALRPSAQRIPEDRCIAEVLISAQR